LSALLVSLLVLIVLVKLISVSAAIISISLVSRSVPLLVFFSLVVAGQSQAGHRNIILVICFVPLFLCQLLQDFLELILVISTTFSHNIDHCHPLLACVLVFVLVFLQVFLLVLPLLSLLLLFLSAF